jgi:hypothetical protein
MIPNDFTIFILQTIQTSVKLHSKCSLARLFGCSASGLTKHLDWLQQAGKISLTKMPIQNGKFSYIIKPSTKQ